MEVFKSQYTGECILLIFLKHIFIPLGNKEVLLGIGVLQKLYNAV